MAKAKTATSGKAHTSVVKTTKQGGKIKTSTMIRLIRTSGRMYQNCNRQFQYCID
jgi:hypothetical protein